MFAAPTTYISSPVSREMPQRKVDELYQPSLYTSASCMDFRQQRREDDGSRQRRPNQHLLPTQQPHSSPLPQTQWTDVPPVYRPQNWVYQEEVSPVATRQTYQPFRPDPPSGWRARPPPPPPPPQQHQPTGSATASQNPDRPKRRRAPRIFRRQDTVDSPQQPQPFDITMLYPQMSPYDSSRMSTYSAPEQLEHSQYDALSQSNTTGFAPSWSALPSRSDEPAPIGIPRSPTYPPAGRRRMRSSAGFGDAAFDDEQDFRLFVEATAGLPPNVGFSPTQQPQSPRRRTTIQGRQRSVPTVGMGETSPVAETPTTLEALQQLAAIPHANQTYRPQTSQPAHRWESQTSLSHQQTRQESKVSPPSQAARADPNRDRLAASASGLDLWLPSPVSPQAQTTTPIPRRPVGPSTARTASVPSHYSAISPLTPTDPLSQTGRAQPPTSAPPPAFPDVDNEIIRLLEELELEEEGEGREYDDELPDYAQSQAEAQEERRAEAARRARELQERWLRRGR